MSAFIMNRKVRSLPGYQYLRKQFNPGFLRQIDKYITVRRGRNVLIANSFFINNVLLAFDDLPLKLLEMFSEPLNLNAFLNKAATEFQLDMVDPKAGDLNRMRTIFDILKQMIQCRFLVEMTFDEYTQLKKFRSSLFPLPRDPAVVYIIPALGCNFSCPRCFVYRSNRKRTGMMSANVFDYQHNFVMTTLSRDVRSRLKYIFYGGEPLLNKPLIEYAANRIRFLERKGCYGRIRPAISVITNASLIDESFINTCRKYHMTLSISFDGVKASHDSRRLWQNGRGTFTDVLRNIRLVEKCKHDYSLSWTIWPENMDRIPGEIAWVVKNLKTRSIFFNFAHSFNDTPYEKMGEQEFFSKMHTIYDVLRECGISEGRLSRYRLANKAKKTLPPYPFYCAAVGGGQFVLRPDGKVGLCQAGLMRDEKQWIKPEKLLAASDDPEKVRWITRTPLYMKRCYLDCAYFSRCPGGCAYVADKSGMKISDPHPSHCIVEKFMIERAIIEDYL